jgi:hypothetical protein
MATIAGYLHGGGGLKKRYKLGVTVIRGVLLASEGDNPLNGFGPATTTTALDSPGVSLDAGTYSTTQADPEGLVSVEVRPDAIIRMLMSGGATEGTALTVLSNTSASSGGTLVTDADVGSNSMISGTLWGLTGANVGQSRKITAHSSGSTMTVTVPFDRGIAVGDEFLFSPWSVGGDGTDTTDGGGNVQFTTLLTQADATIASGTGASEVVYDLELNGRSDSYVLFINGDHLFSGVQTV